MYITHEEYKQTVRDTAAVPESNYLYYAIGLIGECLEFEDDSTLDEFGDIIWYFDMLNFIYNTGIDFDRMTIHRIHVKPSELTRIAIEIGQLANKQYRKTIQGKPEHEINLVIAKIKTALGDLGFRIASVTNVGQAMMHNRSKLQRRLKKGAI